MRLQTLTTNLGELSQSEVIIEKKSLKDYITMFIHVINANYIDNYSVWLSFNDGTEGKVDLSLELEGKIFEPLKDISYLKIFKL